MLLCLDRLPLSTKMVVTRPQMVITLAERPMPASLRKNIFNLNNHLWFILPNVALLASNLGKPAGPRAMPESQRPRNPIWQWVNNPTPQTPVANRVSEKSYLSASSHQSRPSAPQSRPSTPPNHQGPPPELHDGKGPSKEKADKAARRRVVINEPQKKKPWRNVSSKCSMNIFDIVTDIYETESRLSWLPTTVSRDVWTVLCQWRTCDWLFGYYLLSEKKNHYWWLLSRWILCRKRKERKSYWNVNTIYFELLILGVLNCY